MPIALALAVETSAKTIVITDFATDPSGADFTISAVPAGQGASNNLASNPALIFGVTDPVTSVGNTLQMQWNPLDDDSPAQAGWALIFGTDPDITNHVLTLSINPPGVGNPALPGGMTHVEVHVVDGAVGRSGWGFNTNQAGAVPLGNDPIPGGKAPVAPLPVPPGISASLAQNFMQTVMINLATGPVAGSAVIMGGPAGLLIGPNYLITGVGGAADLTQATKLEFYENGVLAGNAAIPVNLPPGTLNNYWDHVSLQVPAPGTLALLGIGLAAVAAGRGRRRD